MKRRNFLTKLTAAVATAKIGVKRLFGSPAEKVEIITPSASSAKESLKLRLYGVPASIRPWDREEEKLLRLSLKEFDEKTQRRALAVSKLAQDIFMNPRVASLFRHDPQNYLTEIGYPDVTLSMGSFEVKLAFAMGEENIRAAARSKDASRFLDELEKLSLFKYSPRTADPQVPMCTAIAICVLFVYLAVVLMVFLWVFVWVDVITKVSGAVMSSLPKDVYDVRLARILGGQQFASQVCDSIVEARLRQIEEAVPPDRWQEFGITFEEVKQRSQGVLKEVLMA